MHLGTWHPRVWLLTRPLQDKWRRSPLPSVLVLLWPPASGQLSALHIMDMICLDLLTRFQDRDHVPSLLARFHGRTHRKLLTAWSNHKSMHKLLVWTNNKWYLREEIFGVLQLHLPQFTNFSLLIVATIFSAWCDVSMSAPHKRHNQFDGNNHISKICCAHCPSQHDLFPMDGYDVHHLHKCMCCSRYYCTYLCVYSLPPPTQWHFSAPYDLFWLLQRTPRSHLPPKIFCTICQQCLR